MFELLSKVTPESKLRITLCTNIIHLDLLKFWIQYAYANVYYIVLNKIVYIAK